MAVTKRKSRWRLISIAGYVLSVFAALSILWDFRTHPDSAEIAHFAADSAMLFVGLFATVIAQSLRGLEERLNEMDIRVSLPLADQ